MNQTQQPPWLVNNIIFCYDREKHMGNDRERKQNKGNHSNFKRAFTDGSKSTGRIVGFAVVFVDVTRRGELPEEASIHTAQMTAMREIKKKEDMTWVICTVQCSPLRTIKKTIPY